MGAVDWTGDVVDVRFGGGGCGCRCGVAGGWWLWWWPVGVEGRLEREIECIYYFS
ncbi:hypothetical protein HanIR_Chr11g0515921 [Helianthus annuus]|nr:hypothetical protein HanIR_Chr11g0515921 [Helianthus annuus]